MFAYPCPSCSQRLLAPEERAGQRTICPRCLKPLTVPQPDQVAQLPFGPPPSEPESFTPPPPEVVETPIPSITELPFTPAAEYDAESHATQLVIELDPVRAIAAELDRAQVAAPNTNQNTRAPYPRPTAPLPSLTSRRSFTGDRSGQVVLNPTGLFEVDVAAELSAAISMRMAPPPEPSLDRTSVTLGWGLGIVLGLSTWALGVFHSPTWFPFVALVGATMIAFGFLWRAYLSGRSGDWMAGVATLLPPVCLVQLFRPIGQHRLRPLAFVVTGLVLCALFVGGPAASAKVDAAIGVKARLPEPATSDATGEKLPELETALEMLDRKADRDAAKKALVKLGAAAEGGLRQKLTSKSEPVVLAACEILEQIGGEKSIDDLRKLADTAGTRAVRVEAATAAEAISARLNATK
jgi:hypothetical protein